MSTLRPLVFGVVFLSLGCRRDDAALAAQGRDLFAATCARCHGAHGGGGLPASPGAPAPRDLRDPAFQASISDERLRSTIVEGKGGAMPAFGAALDGKQLTALVAHVRTLNRSRP